MTDQFDLFASIPPAHDRSKLEADYPDKSTRYLAYCAATGVPPSAPEGWPFQEWIARKCEEFKAVRGLKYQFIPRYMASEFEAWLWEEGRA